MAASQKPCLQTSLLEAARLHFLSLQPSDLLILYASPALQEWYSPVHKSLPSSLKWHELLCPAAKEQFLNHSYPRLQVFPLVKERVRLRDALGSETDYLAFYSKAQTTDGGLILQVLLLAAEADTEDSRQLNLADRELVAALLEGLPGSVYFKDLQGRFLRVNHAKARRHGFDSPTALTGLTDFDLFPLSHASKTYEQERQIAQSAKPLLDQEEQTNRPEEPEHWVSTSKFPLRNKEGTIVGIWGYSRNITEKKLAAQERQAIELQMQLHGKLESIGRLASGIAHEINNPIQYIADNLRFIERSLGPIQALLKAGKACLEDPSLKQIQSPTLEVLKHEAGTAKLNFLCTELGDTLKDTLAGLSKIQHIVLGLKEFSASSKGHASSLELNELIRNTLEVSHSQWAQAASLTLALNPEPIPVKSIRDELQQVILGLITNAVEAIQRKKDSTPEYRGHIAIRSWVEEDRVGLSVEDDGVGIAPEVAPHIFEPFFTTKTDGSGVGHGLAMARNSIITRLGGDISFESVPGGPTRFTVTLPRTGTGM